MISGEHGIGITKLDYLSDDEIRPFREYKNRVDPQGNFNRGKLLNLPEMRGDLTNAYTPSFALLGVESLIMEQSEIGKISESIKKLSALWQMQTGLFDARAACQLALFTAQQNSRYLLAGRSLPLRRANPARDFIATF